MPVFIKYACEDAGKYIEYSENLKKLLEKELTFRLAIELISSNCLVLLVHFVVF